MSDPGEPVAYEGRVERDGIVAEVRVAIPRPDFVTDHDELSESVGMFAMRLVRQACATRDDARAQF